MREEHSADGRAGGHSKLSAIDVDGYYRESYMKIPSRRSKSSAVTVLRSDSERSVGFGTRGAFKIIAVE